ncbi:hypothetical protein PR202_gb27678 [Eleusine coracana subsp. coracana]|uniref:DUF1677 family protein n=1 Tax=Eleusine coracana subsp. coracana TaxID=191504 RepID=A0AAV5FV15_ELECO|nr:hypothetical protein QOZ80_6AG0542700 [Eleusine coracana subsp. coracana]GJN38618.1 hypothetical protein PR202_gb27678 [Eleusine coracana subsp. coracana]
MAPSKEACAVAMAMAAPFIAMASNTVPVTANINSEKSNIVVPATSTGGNSEKRRRTSSDALQRTVSDVSFELHHHRHNAANKENKEAEEQLQLPPVPEVENARCECCGMSEECTPEYIRGVRARFAGRWVCGLCAEAVTEEAEKDGGKKLEEALRAHMGVCKRFNGFGRTHPVLFQAEAMREILRRRAKLGPRSRSSINPREVRAGGSGIARSSSCMPFITDEHDDRVSTNKK